MKTITKQYTETLKMSNFKRLCGLIASEVEVNKVTNQNLARLLNQAISRNGQYVFWSSKPKGHTDHDESEMGGRIEPHTDYSECNTSRGRYTHGDENDACHNDTGYSWTSKHTDHVDHQDTFGEEHTDNRYSESNGHTDSWGGHKDYNESQHTDNCNYKK